MSDIDRTQGLELPPLRFTLTQAFYWTTIAALLASAYAEGGVDGFCSGIFLLPTAFVLFGLFWRDRGIFWTSVLLQVCCIPWMLPSLGHPGKYDNSNCLNNLKNIGTATHNYFDLHKTLPERCEKDGAKRPLLSWRVTLLQYLPTPIRHAFNSLEAWDSPHNLKELDRIENEYRCPTDSRGLWKAKHHTSYVAIAGEETPWPDSGKIDFREIPDGLSNVILVVESHATGITWSEPRDLNEAEINYRVNDDSQPGLSSMHGSFIRYFDGTRRVSHRNGCNILLADGSARRIPNNVDPEVLKALVNRRDGKAVEIP